MEKIHKAPLVVISGPSGSGKGSIIAELVKKLPMLGFSVSATTRAPREGETEGINYYFLSKEEFMDKVENVEFLEYEEVYDGNFYGSLTSEVNRIRESGKIPLFDVDVLGGMSIKGVLPESSLLIFIHPGEHALDVLEERIRKRDKCSDEEIKKRMARAEKELKYMRNFNFVVINKNGGLKKAVRDAKKIIEENCLPERKKRKKLLLLSKALLFALFAFAGLFMSCRASGPEFQRHELMKDSIMVEFSENDYGKPNLRITVKGSRHYTLYFDRDGMPMSGDDYQFYKIPPLVTVPKGNPPEKGFTYPLPNGLPDDFLITVESGGKYEKIVLQ